MERVPDDPDGDVLPAVLAGDLDAFAALVRRHERAIVHLVASIIARTDDAPDLTQEIFVRVHRSLSAFRRDSTFRTWLIRIATNVARTHRTRRLREAPVWGPDDDRGDGPFDPPDRADVEESWIARDAIDHALKGLSEDQRLAITLRDIHGLDYRDIAETIGTPIGTVESRIFRARKRLRARLSELGYR